MRPGILDQLALLIPVAHRDTDVATGEAGVLQIHDRPFGGIAGGKKRRYAAAAAPVPRHRVCGSRSVHHFIPSLLSDVRLRFYPRRGAVTRWFAFR